jgi:hypothetical protein
MLINNQPLYITKHPKSQNISFGAMSVGFFTKSGKEIPYNNLIDCFNKMHNNTSNTDAGNALVTFFNRLFKSEGNGDVKIVITDNPYVKHNGIKSPFEFRSSLKGTFESIFEAMQSLVKNPKTINESPLRSLDNSRITPPLDIIERYAILEN